MHVGKGASEYDLVLVLGFFRRLASYLSIVKYLSREFRIGIFPLPLDESLRSKHRQTQEEFTDLCVGLGAEIVDKLPVTCAVAVIPQQPYTDESLRLVRENLFASRKVALMALAWAGMHDEFLSVLNVDRVFVVHKALYEFLFRHRQGTEPRNLEDMVEVGLPYGKYPVFPEFQADYLLAIPTPFSFPTERDKWDFLETVLVLLEQIDEKDTVVHKPHNAVDYDYFSPARYRHALRFLCPWGTLGEGRALRRVASALPGGLGRQVGQLATACLYQEVMGRVIRMDELTPHHYCALEAFLPGVRKGVIGGLSNTIWGALYFRLPYYNCVDIHRQDRKRGKTLYSKDPSLLLDLNLRFFLVEYCGGKLQFDPKYFQIIDEPTRSADLLESLRVELNAGETLSNQPSGGVLR